MNEIETFTLPVTGKTVLIRGYMTGYIDQEIKRIEALANKTSFEVSPEQVAQSQATGQDPTPTVHMESNPGAKIDADNKRIELMVSAIDGNTGDILDQVMNLPKGDVDFIKEKIATIEGTDKVKAADPKAPTS